MKRIINFEKEKDYITGEYGIIPSGQLGSNFNAFWNPIMIFHDTIEHFFEGERFFKNEFQYNIGGEMVAMGVLFYLNELGIIYERLVQGNTFSPERSIMQSTYNLLEDAIEGDIIFGERLYCAIPYQKPIDSYLEDCLEDQYKRIKKIKTNESGVDFKKSITLNKMKRFYRYGYNLGKKHCPDIYEVRGELIKYWENLKSLTRFYSLDDFAYLSIELETGKHFSYKIILEDYEGKIETIYQSKFNRNNKDRRRNYSQCELSSSV